MQIIYSDKKWQTKEFKKDNFLFKLSGSISAIECFNI